MTVKREVPFMVKRKFDILQTRFGAIFIRAFKLIKEEDLIALKKFLSASFRDTRDEVRDLESMEQLEEFLLDHTSFTDFPMLEALANDFGLEKVEKELVSFIEYRNKMYGQLLAEDFELAGINECVKDSQTEVSCWIYRKCVCENVSCEVHVFSWPIRLPMQFFMVINYMIGPLTRFCGCRHRKKSME